MLNRPSSSSKKCPPVTNLTLNSNEQKKKNKNNKKKKQRSPLQDLNSISRANSSGSTAVSSSMSMEAPKGCLRFFLSSNSSSLKTPLHKQTSAPNSSKPYKPSVSSFSSRSKLSKENSFAKQSQKPKKNPPTPNCLYQWQSGRKPTSNKPSKTHLLPALGNVVNNSASGSEYFVVNEKHFNQKGQKQQQHDSGEPLQFSKFNDLNNVDMAVDNCTPTSKSPCGSVLDAATDNSSKLVQEEHSNTGTTSTKTPPVQASVSPEIQCGPSSILVASATPVCYGAGHVVSGITDRRKCRPRGILAVGRIDSSGCNKTNLLDNEEYNMGALENSRPSLIPLPAEASMQWLLSPRHENKEDCKGDSACKLLGCQKLLESATLDLPSSPSSCHLFCSDLSNNANYSGDPDTTRNGVKTRIILLSPRRISEFDASMGPLSDKLDSCLSSGSPHATPCCKADFLQEERKRWHTMAGEISPLSIGSLSSGNVIQTPKSESSSDRKGGLSRSNAGNQQCCNFEFERGSVLEALWRESLSPKSQVSKWDPPGLRFQITDLALPSDSINLDKLQKSLDTHASWMSNSTLENVSQSLMRISWREGLMSRIFEMDDFDCCRCLSEEENEVDVCGNQLKSQPYEESNFDVGNDLHSHKDVGSPELLDQEPTILGKGKAKLSPQRPNYCAESICTDGGSLVASGDSDWTVCYKNQLFQV